jgi:hypothetical protein
MLEKPRGSGSNLRFGDECFTFKQGTCTKVSSV